MVCVFQSLEEHSQSMFTKNSIQSKSNISIEKPESNEDDLDQKRRQLLIRSAKRPGKRSRCVQKQRLREEKDETDTVTTASLSESSASTSTSASATRSPISKKSKIKHLRRHKRENRRMVSFGTEYNTTTFVPSHKDFSPSERRAYYFQRDEYVRIKRNIQRTIEFLKSPSDSSSSSSRSGSRSHSNRKINVAEEHCIRGLECLAEENVNDYKKRIQKTSKTAVFRFQEHRRRRLGGHTTFDEAHEASLALADIYKKCTSQCESVARRWGHFDAIDAGVDPTVTAFLATEAVNRATANPSSIHNEPAVGTNITVETSLVDNNASLSSLSYDGDDGEEENEGNDEFNFPPVVNAGEPVNAFDSLPGDLLNF